MSWLQASLHSCPDNAEAVAHAFEQAGALSVTWQNAGDIPVYEPVPGEAPLWRHTRITGLFEPAIHPESIGRVLRTALGSMYQEGSLQIEWLDEQAWELAWQEHSHPICFGNRLWVAPTDVMPETLAPAQVVLCLDPGLAFGTGNHPTTALCLEWLGRARLDGRQVIDYGCGSGILGIAALLLGADYVWAVDLDDQALLATQENATKNHCETALSTHRPEQLPTVRADLILANILADPLMELAPRLARHTKPHAQIVLSGILATQVEQIAEFYQPFFRMDPPVVREGWALLTGQRRW